jgi:phosphatidylserine/phosphatidylglycerophosphate/cardiolipin synthase-like enzyme
LPSGAPAEGLVNAGTGRPRLRWPLRTLGWGLVFAAGALALAGCLSLQRLVPDLERRPAPEVPLEGARGPLSAAQSKAVLASKEGAGPDTGIFDEHLAREQAILRSPLTAGNRVRLLQDGPTTYQAMLEAILAARDHINMVKIHERHGVVLHSKAVLIDGVWATVGSTNLDWRSFLHNHELNAVVLGVGFGRQVQAMFATELAGSEAITLEQWSQRPLHLHLQEWIASLWEYWL